MTEIVRFYDAFDRFKTGENGPEKKSSEFWDMPSQYTVYATLAHEGLGTRQGCISAAKAIELVSPKNMSPQCRTIFLQTKNEGTPDTEFLVSDLADFSYQQRAERLAALEEVRTAYMQCEKSTRDQKVAELRNLALNQPMYRVIDGACHQLTQPELLAQLDNISERMPDHCAMTTVPKAMIGLTTNKAGKALEASKLFLSGLVDVSKVIGKTDGEARKALTAVGLVPAYADEILADQENMVPGNIHAASHIAGDKLPKGSTVTLTKIAPKPTVAVPSIAGAKTLNDVRAILAGTKLATGTEFEAATMPDGATPGEFFTRDPAAGTPVEMFSPVTPIRYLTNLRPVPRVSALKVPCSPEI